MSGQSAFNNSTGYDPFVRAANSPNGDGTDGECKTQLSNTYNTCHPGFDKKNLPTSVRYPGDEICTTADTNFKLQDKHNLWMNCRNNRECLH